MLFYVPNLCVSQFDARGLFSINEYYIGSLYTTFVDDIKKIRFYLVMHTDKTIMRLTELDYT